MNNRQRETLKFKKKYPRLYKWIMNHYAPVFDRFVAIDMYLSNTEPPVCEVCGKRVQVSAKKPSRCGAHRLYDPVHSYTYERLVSTVPGQYTVWDGEKNTQQPVEVHCEKHGPYTQPISSVLKGHGCQQCYFELKIGKHRIDKEAYLRDFREHHGDFYDYSNVKLLGCQDLIEIRCPVHGLFQQQANLHKAGHGCPKCANDKTRERFSDEESKKRLRRVAVDNLIKRAESKAPSSIEVKCASYLSNKKLDYEYQFVIDDQERGAWIYDFYVESLNLLIEVDGEYYHTFKDTHNRDKIKTRLAEQRGFKILRLSDKDLRFDLIEHSEQAIKQHTSDVLDSRSAHLKNRPPRKKKNDSNS